MRIFLDSSFIISLINKNDSNNENALKILNQIRNDMCYVNNFVLNEIMTVIGMKVRLTAALLVYEVIKENCIVLNEFNIYDFMDNTKDLYKKYNEQNIKLSFTDCSILETMNEHNIVDLASFDKNFKKIDGINLYSTNL